jgi:hypothetical protein
MTTTLFQLMTALVHGSALHAAGLKAVLAVKREDAMRYNVPDQRPGGTDSGWSTGVSSPGSLHLVCSACFSLLSENAKPRVPRIPMPRPLSPRKSFPNVEGPL